MESYSIKQLHITVVLGQCWSFFTVFLQPKNGRRYLSNFTLVVLKIRNSPDATNLIHLNSHYKANAGKKVDYHGVLTDYIQTKENGPEDYQKNHQEPYGKNSCGKEEEKRKQTK